MPKRDAGHWEFIYEDGYVSRMAWLPGPTPAVERLPVATYERTYGRDNVWVRWLAKHAPRLLLLTPGELHRYLRSDAWDGPTDWEQREAAA